MSARKGIEVSAGQIRQLSMIVVGFVIALQSGCRSQKVSIPGELPELPKETPALSPLEACEEAMRRLKNGEQFKAESILKKYYSLYPHHQRLVFSRAACIRSRFSIRRSFPLFMTVAQMNINSVSGQCASLILRIDGGIQIDQTFRALEKLVEEHPEDIMVRWMLAVQCRAHDRNKLGVRHYRKILDLWSPGPSMVHQTYGNLLDELDRHEEALVQRRMAVELEPAAWTYQGLGNTLGHLGRFDEAYVAYEKMIEFDPNDADYWRCWGWALLRDGKYEESIEKSIRAIELAPSKRQYQAWGDWGRCLEKMGHLEEALEKYMRALELNPDDRYARNRAFCVLRDLGREEEARTLKNENQIEIKRGEI